MSQQLLEAHYRPNWGLAELNNFRAFNCGYERSPADTFDRHQQSLVWQLLGDTPITENSVVLDVGCGIGGPAGWIAERNHPRRVIGLEFCDFNIRNAHKVWSSSPASPSFIQGDAHKLPLQSASVDVILNLESALHYRNKPAFLAECRRVLKPDGWLCLGDITSRSPRSFNMASAVLRSEIFLFSPAQYKSAFRDAGFNVVRHEDASLPVSRSLDAGLEQMKKFSFREKWGTHGRCGFLRLLEILFRRGWLSYDLFGARPVS